MAKKSKSGIVKAKRKPLTKRQKGKAIKAEEMPPCAGNAGLPCKTPIQPFLVQGYDGKLRCASCNNVHTEEVFRESGDGVAPSSTVPTAKVATAMKRQEIERRKQILDRNAPRGGRKDPPPPASEGGYRDMKSMRAGGSGSMTESERRAAIFKKYDRLGRK